LKPIRLFHISETPGIETFIPRPSPSDGIRITEDIVWAITDTLLHNYLLPRDCPRVTFYARPDSLPSDIEKYIGQTTEDFVIAVENNWYLPIQETTLYCYEFPADNFQVVDEGAGYYISYKTVNPISVIPILNPLAELLKRKVEVRFIPTLGPLADEIKRTSLQYSLIRMRNAIPLTPAHK
jgi:hypothetical protein